MQTKKAIQAHKQITQTHTITDTLMQAERAVKCALLSGCYCLWPADMEKVEIQSVTLWQEPQVCVCV